MTIHGDGSAARDWLFAGDTVKGIDLAIRAPIAKVKGEVFNLATGRSISILEIAHLISAEFGRKSDLDFGFDRFGQVQKHIGATTKAEAILGFKASTSFEEGLKKTIEWYKNNQQVWRKQIAMKKVPVKTKDGTTVWY